jgi:hypothetical protein
MTLARERFAALMDEVTTGKRTLAKIAMMPMTTSNSIKVKPEEREWRE